MSKDIKEGGGGGGKKKGWGRERHHGKSALIKQKLMGYRARTLRKIF